MIAVIMVQYLLCILWLYCPPRGTLRSRPNSGWNIFEVCLSEADELLRIVTSIHVQGLQTTVFAADGSSRTLQLYRVVIPDGAIVSNERLDSWNKRGNP